MSCGDPHGTPCREVLDRVYHYLDGELDAQRMHVIREHLEECGPCLREFGLEGAVKALVRRACHDRAPDELRSKVLLRIESLRVDVTSAEVTSVEAASIDVGVRASKKG